MGDFSRIFNFLENSLHNYIMRIVFHAGFCEPVRHFFRYGNIGNDFSDKLTADFALYASAKLARTTVVS
jgi:hypothetical protein